MELITILSETPRPKRRWCGNDVKGNFICHGQWPRNPNSRSIRLCWKANSAAQEHYIGTFLLHLDALLAKGYIRDDAPGKVRVKFINDNGVIKLSQGFDCKGIVVGIF